MDPLTIGALTTLVRSVFTLIQNAREKGDLTPEQAKALMDEADQRRKDAIARWDSLAPPGG